MINSLFKSIIDADYASVVICSPEHIILYMNPAAVKNYANRGGAELVGKSIFGCHNPKSNEMIEKIVNWFAASPEHNSVHTFYNEKQQKDVYMIALRDDGGKLIGYYEKHEFRAKDTSPFYAMD
ncbi:MAG: PAS domain-containing protein [Oscillospiraceae bacterium]|nr:PAS domain-containing protein [Oscillospiraceae bacterium]